MKLKSDLNLMQQIGQKWPSIQARDQRASFTK